VPDYRLTAAADADLSDIYAYTTLEFGERQADAYFESLEDCLNRLGANPQLGRDASLVREGYRLFIHKQHSIYFKPEKSGILVVRVPGPGMTAEPNLP
jgi:toxin ParE1/3/4